MLLRISERLITGDLTIAQLLLLAQTTRVFSSMTDKYKPIAFKGTIKDAGRSLPDEAPFLQQRDRLNELELSAYKLVMLDIRAYGPDTSRISADTAPGVFLRGGEYFKTNNQNPIGQVTGRYAVVNIAGELRGIAVLFIASGRNGPNTIELIGLRRFKSYSDGLPNHSTVEHVIPPKPKKHDDNF